LDKQIYDNDDNVMPHTTLALLYINDITLFTDVLPWQRVLRSKMVLEYILIEFANMEDIFQSLTKNSK